MTSKFDIDDLSLSDELDSDKNNNLGKCNLSSSGDDCDDHIQIPVKYMSPLSSNKPVLVNKQQSLDAGPNYSSLKKKTVSHNLHTVIKEHKRGPVFYQSKNDNTSSTTSESSATSSSSSKEEEVENTSNFLLQLKEKPKLTTTTTTNKKPTVNKNLDSFLGFSLNTNLSNLYLKNTDTKLNYNDNVVFNASESGNAFDEQNLKAVASSKSITPPSSTTNTKTTLDKTLDKTLSTNTKTTLDKTLDKNKPFDKTLDKNKPLDKTIDKKNDTYNIYLKKSSQSMDALKNLSIPYHCHMKGMCKGPFSKKNQRIHQLEKTDASLMDEINENIVDLTPTMNKDIISMVLFGRKYADYEEQKFIMISKDVFNQEVTTMDYEVDSMYGNHVIMINLSQKPRFDEFFKDKGLSKIIKLDFAYPGKKSKCGFLFYINDEEMFEEDRKIFIHKSMDKEDMAPPLIIVFNKIDDVLRLDTIWVFYGEKSMSTQAVNDIHADIKKFVNGYMSSKK